MFENGTMRALEWLANFADDTPVQSCDFIYFNWFVHYGVPTNGYLEFIKVALPNA